MPGRGSGPRENRLVHRSVPTVFLPHPLVLRAGKLSALKHVKDDVTTAGTGSDCGVSFEDFGDIQEGDTIVCFETRLQRPVLSEN